jgi:nematocidal protein AidA
MEEKNLPKGQPFTDVDQLSVSETTVYINVVVDAQELINRYKNPSKNSGSPTQISPQDVKDCVYLVATRGDVISGHGGSDLKVQVYNEDRIRWTATSETQNSDCTVTLYGITHYTGQTIIKNPTYDMITKQVFVPSDTDPTIGAFTWSKFPSMIASTNDFQGQATENYYFKFSLYARDRKTGQYLYGYFMIDPAIVIN